MPSEPSAEWIAVDYGAAQSRAWAMDSSGRMRAERILPCDRQQSLPSATARLRERLGVWLGDWLPQADAAPVPVLLCGAAQDEEIPAPIGRTVPCPPLAADDPLRAADTDAGVDGQANLDLWRVPPLTQNRPNADIMAGDETRIAGFLTERPDFDGVLCLADRHSTWARISAGEVVSFQSFLTTELYHLLADRSALRHALLTTPTDSPGETPPSPISDTETFAAAVTDAMARPAAIGARLLALRAESILSGLRPESAADRLWGLLIGLELAAARPYWLGQDLGLIAAPATTARYRIALAAQGVAGREYDRDQMTRNGLDRAFRTWKEG